MIGMTFVDRNGGTMFNHRRQSQDRVLREHILKLAEGRPIWMSAYTARQFPVEQQDLIREAESPLSAAGRGELCLVEGEPLLPYEAQLESLILFRWDRVYPADTCLDIPLEEHGWRLVERSEFPGYSHEKIVQEVYQK